MCRDPLAEISSGYAIYVQPEKALMNIDITGINDVDAGKYRYWENDLLGLDQLHTAASKETECRPLLISRVLNNPDRSAIRQQRSPPAQFRKQAIETAGCRSHFRYRADRKGLDRLGATTIVKNLKRLAWLRVDTARRGRH